MCRAWPAYLRPVLIHHMAQDRDAVHEKYSAKTERKETMPLPCDVETSGASISRFSCIFQSPQKSQDIRKYLRRREAANGCLFFWKFQVEVFFLLFFMPFQLRICSGVSGRTEFVDTCRGKLETVCAAASSVWAMRSSIRTIANKHSRTRRGGGGVGMGLTWIARSTFLYPEAGT